jgi:three-Cys-motif partner protein
VIDDQLDLFSAFYEAGPRNWGATPEPPPTDLEAPQLSIMTKDGLVPYGETPGALARTITPHSLIKQDRIYRYANTVSIAMARKWKIWWIDLFAGPGMVFDRESSEFRDAVPLQLVNGLRRPFDGYVFSDLGEECVGSLKKLLGAQSQLTIEQGDANDHQYLERLIAPIPRDALVLAYLDPEGLDLHFETIRFLAWRFRHLDLLLNMPVHAIDRSISANAVEPVKRVLEHPEPQQLLAGRRTGERIRAWFKSKMKDLGYPPELIIGNEIRSLGNKAPQYDLLLASRSETAIKLYRQANQVDGDGQRGFELAV